MDRRATITPIGNDRALQGLLDAASESERSAETERLVTRLASPVIDGILARHRTSALRQEDLDDIRATIVLRLIDRLDQLVAGVGKPIGQFEDYVATLAYNSVYDFLRRRFPERTRLKNRLRYVVAHDERFATHAGAEGVWCSLRSWGNPPLRPRSVLPSAGPDRLDRDDLATSLATMLTGLGRPALLDDLVQTAAEQWNVTEGIPTDEPQVEHCTIEGDLERRQYVEMLWNEIRLLPPSQRAALLLNLRDGQGSNALALFLLLGLATIDQLGGLLGMASERLTEIWGDLPIDDLGIAKILGLTRQQIINLRKSARLRLARRMSAFERKEQPR